MVDLVLRDDPGEADRAFGGVEDWLFLIEDRRLGYVFIPVSGEELRLDERDVRRLELFLEG